MKLDASVLRYLTKEDFRILSSLEIGSKNHEVVPLTMLASLCRMRPGGLNARLGELAKYKLVSKEHGRGYEGFRLTYGGYDYLALHALSLRGSVSGVGRQIGVGKEADVYLVTGSHLKNEQSGADLYPQNPLLTPPEYEFKSASSDCSSDKDIEVKDVDDEDDFDFVLKIERLGRTSFRTVKTNRDYIGKRKHTSWMYLSRLAAEKEWAFLCALHKRGFPTPRPVDHSRHCIVMGWVNGVPLDQVSSQTWDGILSPQDVAQYLFEYLMRLIVRLAEHGLVHGDFNEFNLLLRQQFIEDPRPYIDRLLSGELKTLSLIEKKSNDIELVDHNLSNSDECAKNSPVVMIDFPQMISVQHVNAAEQFDRDVRCLRTFFTRRFNYEPSSWPIFEDDILTNLNAAQGSTMDQELRASGYRRQSAESDSESDESAELDSDTSEELELS